MNKFINYLIGNNINLFLALCEKVTLTVVIITSINKTKILYNSCNYYNQYLLILYSYLLAIYK